MFSGIDCCRLPPGRDGGITGMDITILDGKIIEFITCNRRSTTILGENAKTETRAAIVRARRHTTGTMGESGTRETLLHPDGMVSTS